MQSVKKDIRNVREADSIKTLSNSQASHKCGFQHQVYANVTLAYNASKVFYKVKQCSAIPAALQWVEVTDITLAVEQGGTVNCVKHIRHENSSYIVVGGESYDKKGVVWIVCIKSGRLIRNCFTTSSAVSTLSCYSSPSLISSPGLVIVLGTRQCHLYILHVNPLTSPNSKQKHLLPTTFLEDISSTTLGSSTHPCFEIGAKTRVKGVWNYMLPGMKSAGVFKEADVSCVELLDSMGCVVAGYSNGGWQIWSVAGSKAVLQFTSSLIPDTYPVTNFCLLTPENDPHHILYLWVTHSQTGQKEAVESPATTATMYQLRFRNRVLGSKPGVNDQYRRIESLIQSFSFDLSRPMFIGKESGVFQRLVDFEAIQRVNYLQGCNDFNGVVISLDTTKFIITVLFDLNAWYFAQMPALPNQVARLSPYISYLPLEKTTMPAYCCLQAVKVKAQSLFRGKLSSSEACNVFPCSLNTVVRYHIGKNIVNAFYFPTNELAQDPGNSVQGLADLALKGIFTKHNTLVQSKKGRLRVLEFLTSFLPDLKIALNDAMSPMLSGLPTADTELKNLRELLSVTSHCIHLGNKLRKVLPDQDGYLVLYQHTYHYARTVLALTDMRVLPFSHASLQDFGCRMLPVKFTAIGELLDNVSGLPELWEDEMFPPKTIRSLLNVFYTKPLNLTLQGYVVAYSVLYLDKDDMDIRNLNTLSAEDADAITSIFYLDRRDYKKFIKYLPSKSGVFEYCNINSICDILLQQKKKHIAVQMLTVLDESYVSQYSPKTMSLLADTLSSQYKIDLISSGASDLLSFSTVLDEQLTHKQFSALLKSLDNQERFDCLFYLILKKNKLCDLMSAYGETKHSQKSSSQFLEFMFLYTIKHFSDIELKASITACQGGVDNKEHFNENVPLSAQKCQNDLSVLSRFCLRSDLGGFKLGTSPKPKRCVSDNHIVRTPPPKSLDISDDLLLQLRTPHPTPLKEKVLTALEAPRSILRSSKTERKNRKRIRFDDPSDALPESKPTRLSFGGVEFSAPSSSSSPTKRLTFDEDITLHEGVSLADISPPKPIIESVVRYDDTIGDDEHIPVPQELSNDSISFEIFGAKAVQNLEDTSTVQSEVSINIPENVAEISEMAQFSPDPEDVSSDLDVPQDQSIVLGQDDSHVDESMEESFVSAASADSLVQKSDFNPQEIYPDRAVSVHSSIKGSTEVQPARLSIEDTSLEEISTSPASPDPLPEYPDCASFDLPAQQNPQVISLDSSGEVQEIESAEEEEEAEEDKVGEVYSTEGDLSGDNDQDILDNTQEESVGEEDDVEGEDEDDDEEDDEDVVERAEGMAVEREVSEGEAHSERSGGSVQVIGIDSSHSDVENEQDNPIIHDEVNTSDSPNRARAEAEQSDGSGSIQVIGVNSGSESSDPGSEESGEESDSSDGGDSSGQDPDTNMVETEEVPESGDEVEEVVPEAIESVSESSSPVVVKGAASPRNVNSGTEADTESSDEEHVEQQISDEEINSHEEEDQPPGESSIIENITGEIDLELTENVEAKQSGEADLATEMSDTESASPEVQHVLTECGGNDMADVSLEEVTEVEQSAQSPAGQVLGAESEIGESAVNIPGYEIHDTESVVMVMDTSDNSSEHQSKFQQSREDLQEGSEEINSSNKSESYSEPSLVELDTPGHSSETKERVPKEEEKKSVTSLASSYSPSNPVQGDESFVSATDDAPYADTTSLNVGQILESDESDDEEEFEFKAPEQIVPQSTWFMETFPDHDKLSFDFNAPHRVAPSTHRTTRSRTRKLRAIGTSDVLPPPAPLIKFPSPSTLVPSPPITLPDSPPTLPDSESMVLAPEVTTSNSVVSTSPQALNISARESDFSPEQPEYVQHLELPKSQTTQIPSVASPFSASLAQFIPERSCPKYQLSKSEDGTLKLRGVEPVSTAEAIDISGDTESLEGSEFQSFTTQDDNLEKSMEQKCMSVERQPNEMGQDSSFLSLAETPDEGPDQILGGIPDEDPVPLVEQVESDQTESLPSPQQHREFDGGSASELVNVPSDVADFQIVSEKESELVEIAANQSPSQDELSVTQTASVDIEPSVSQTSTGMSTSDYAIISEPEIIPITESATLPSTPEKQNDEEQVPKRNLRSRNEPRGMDSGPSRSLKSDPSKSSELDSEENVLDDEPCFSKTGIKNESEGPDKSKIRDTSAAESKPYKILQAPRLLRSKAGSSKSSSCTAEAKPHKILRAPRVLRSQKQLVDDVPAVVEVQCQESQIDSTEEKSITDEVVSESSTTAPASEELKADPKSSKTRRRGRKNSPLSTSPSDPQTKSERETPDSPERETPDSPPKTRKTLRSKSDKTSKSPPPTKQRTLRSKPDKVSEKSGDEQSEIPVELTSEKPPKPESPPATRRNLRRKTEQSEKESTETVPEPSEPQSSRRTQRLRSKPVLSESNSGKGKLRPRQHTNSESNSEEKPANKMRKSVSPREEWSMPLSPNKAKPPPPITVTRSSRRLRKQQASSDETAALPDRATSTVTPESTPVRIKRGTRKNKPAAPSASESSVESGDTTRLTRRRKNPSEAESSSSQQSAAESMPAKKSRGASSRQTRNTPARAASSTASSVEKRETRSSRKGSGK